MRKMAFLPPRMLNLTSLYYSESEDLKKNKDLIFKHAVNKKLLQILMVKI